MTLTRRFVPEVTYDTIGNYRVTHSIDSFSIGSKRTTFYPDSTKFVELAKKVYVLENVIGKIGKAASKANFTSKVATDKVVAILNNPNQKQSKEEFIKEYAFYLKASGWCVIWKRYGSYGIFDSLELINLDPDKTTFATNGNILSEYDGKEETIEPRDCIVFYDSIREKSGKGYSKIKPLRSQVENALLAQIALGIQMENSGTTIVSPKQVSGGSNQVDDGLDKIAMPSRPGQETQKDQIEARLNHRGIENRIVVATRGLDATSLSTGLNGVDFSKKVETPILAICDAFGVNVELTPYGKTSTFDNKDVAELSLLENEAAPLINSLVRSLNQDLKGKAEADWSHVGAMSVVNKRVQESNGTTISQYMELVNNEVITPQDAKRILESKGIEL